MACRPTKLKSIVRFPNISLSFQTPTSPCPSIKRAQINTSRRLSIKTPSLCRHISPRPSNRRINQLTNNHSNNRMEFLEAVLTFSQTLRRVEMLDSIRRSRERRKIWYKLRKRSSACISTMQHYNSVK
jgi:hypothetical protein